jgi:hypothetical protein
MPGSGECYEEKTGRASRMVEGCYFRQDTEERTVGGSAI